MCKFLSATFEVMRHLLSTDTFCRLRIGSKTYNLSVTIKYFENRDFLRRFKFFNKFDLMRSVHVMCIDY